MLDVLLKSISAMPSVFLRTLPVGIVVSFIYFGLLFNATDPVLRLLILVAFTQPCIAIMRVAALRASLVYWDATTPPTFKLLTRAQLRLIYGNLMPISLVQMAAFGLVSVVVVADFRDDVFYLLKDFAFEGIFEPSDDLAPRVGGFVQAAGWLFVIIAAAGFGVMGTAMAATCANAAEKTPRHDITFGVGFNFLTHFVLYFLAQILNAVIVAILLIVAMTLIGATEGEAFQYVMIGAVTIYISLVFATTAGGAGYSYSILLEIKEDERQFIQANIAGPQTSTEDLRALRRARQH